MPGIGPALVLGLAALGGTAPDWQQLYQRPVGPGLIALLVDHADDPRTLETWRNGLASPLAVVRIASARVIAVTGRAELLADLEKALAAEADVKAAAEQVRALVTLGDEAIERHCLERVELLPGSVGRALAEALARKHGPEVRVWLGKLLELDASPQRWDRSVDWERFFLFAARQSAGALAPLAVEPLRRENAVAWRGLLEALRGSGHRAVPAFVVAGVTSACPAIREATALYLAGARLEGELPGVVDAALRQVSADDPRGDSEAGFALELLGRADGRAGAVDWTDWIAAQPARRLRSLPLLHGTPPLATLLTSSERRALEKQLGHSLQLDGSARRAPLASRDSTFGGLRTADFLPPGMLRELLQGSGCKDTDVAVARVTYEWDGRARTVELADSGLSEDCGRALGALFRLASATGVTSPSSSEHVVFPLNASFRACRLEAEAQTAPPAPGSSPAPRGAPDDVPGSLQEPRRVHNVNPRYPEWARRKRREGQVVLGVEISPTGCITALEILRSVDASLDYEALRAVSQWRYAPTLLDGSPVPVLMTVTVNFRLR